MAHPDTDGTHSKRANAIRLFIRTSPSSALPRSCQSALSTSPTASSEQTPRSGPASPGRISTAVLPCSFCAWSSRELAVPKILATTPRNGAGARVRPLDSRIPIFVFQPHMVAVAVPRFLMAFHAEVEGWGTAHSILMANTATITLHLPAWATAVRTPGRDHLTPA